VLNNNFLSSTKFVEAKPLTTTSTRVVPIHTTVGKVFLFSVASFENLSFRMMHRKKIVLMVLSFIALGTLLYYVDGPHSEVSSVLSWASTSATCCGNLVSACSCQRKRSSQKMTCEA